jgi:hypothetical protein
MIKKLFIVYVIIGLVSVHNSDAQTPIFKGIVKNAVDGKAVSNVHVINLSKVIGTISNVEGAFEIPAEANDTLYLSYLGFKPIKVRVASDFLKYDNSIIELTERALALEEVVVKPYELTGYLEIDAKNVPISTSYRYNIPGLPTRGYEAGSRNPNAISKVFGAIFNPADFLYNLFGKKPMQFKKLRKMQEDNQIRDFLATKFDRQTLVELLQIEKLDLDEILRNCNFSDTFITSANDLQILEAISGCYEEYKILNRS